VMCSIRTVPGGMPQQRRADVVRKVSRYGSDYLVLTECDWPVRPDESRHRGAAVGMEPAEPACMVDPSLAVAAH
jgi:hypothetical protein